MKRVKKVKRLKRVKKAKGLKRGKKLKRLKGLTFQFLVFLSPLVLLRTRRRGCGEREVVSESWRECHCERSEAISHGGS
ncbi:MAG: hypothetical protein KBE65_09240 [Phycisphaerae bacterium]|nr:hypothetical protein [Phycisphaerae bacterium]